MGKKKSASGTSMPGRGSSTTTQKRAGNGHTQSHQMINDLEDGFFGELADMLHGERQILQALPKLAQAASSPRLREAFEVHLEQTQHQVERLEKVFKLFGRRAQTEKCEGLQGIIEEGNELLQKTSEGPVRDAMLIAAAQKVEHYEIASYGTLCAWAEQLNAYDAVRLLEETLHEEKTADKILNRVAESFANQQAQRGRGMEQYGMQQQGMHQGMHQQGMHQQGMHQGYAGGGRGGFRRDDDRFQEGGRYPEGRFGDEQHQPWSNEPRQDRYGGRQSWARAGEFDDSGRMENDPYDREGRRRRGNR
jgi:ferritin-like metal-binding protein YciE